MAASYQIEQVCSEIEASGYDMSILAQKLSRFTYRSEKHDNVYPPEIMEIHGAGDCDDYALYCCEVMRRIGIEAYYVAIRNKQMGHAVCSFRKQGEPWYHIGNWGLSCCGFDSIETMASNIYHDWNILIKRDRTFGLLQCIVR